MAEDGLIARASAEGDHRCVELSLAEKGKSLFNRALPVFEECTARQFGMLSAAELEAFRAALERISAATCEGGVSA